MEINELFDKIKINYFAEDLENALKKENSTEIKKEIIPMENGFKVYRLKKLDLEEVPEKDKGVFYTGDSYVVILTEDTKHKVYIWIGKDSTNDEIGGAIFKTLQIDDILKGKLEIIYETQNYESAEFTLLFGKKFCVRAGGYVSSYEKFNQDAFSPGFYDLDFKKIDGTPEKEEEKDKPVDPNLYIVNFLQREIKIAELESNNYSIYDGGKEITIWKGKDAPMKYKELAKNEAKHLIESRGLEYKEKNIKFYEEDDWNSRSYMEDLLSFKPLIPRERIVMKPFMYKISKDEKKVPKLELLNECKKESLKSDGAFIIDVGYNVIVYLGKDSDKADKKLALLSGARFLQTVFSTKLIIYNETIGTPFDYEKYVRTVTIDLTKEIPENADYFEYFSTKEKEFKASFEKEGKLDITKMVSLFYHQLVQHESFAKKAMERNWTIINPTKRFIWKKGGTSQVIVDIHKEHPEDKICAQIFADNSYFGCGIFSGWTTQEEATLRDSNPEIFSYLIKTGYIEKVEPKKDSFRYKYVKTVPNPLSTCKGYAINCQLFSNNNIPLEKPIDLFYLFTSAPSLTNQPASFDEEGGAEWICQTRNDPNLMEKARALIKRMYRKKRKEIRDKNKFASAMKVLLFTSDYEMNFNLNPDDKDKEEKEIEDVLNTVLALFNKDLPVEKEDELKALEKKADESYKKVLERVMKGWIITAKKTGAKYFIGGAVGCGAFYNDPKVISEIIAKVFSENAGDDMIYVYAAYSGESDPNLPLFRNAFMKYGL